MALEILFVCCLTTWHGWCRWWVWFLKCLFVCCCNHLIWLMAGENLLQSPQKVQIV